ncbi:MAG: hypothetical protein Q9168_001178 [Polycauliona sp. 1 TL-2023]
MLRKSRSNIGHHEHLPAGLPTEGDGTPFIAAMIPLQFGNGHEEPVHPITSDPLPPSTPAPFPAPSADIAPPSPRPQSQIAIRSARQSRDGGYNASIASNRNTSPQAFNLFDPTPDHATSDITSTIPAVELAELIGDHLMSNLDTISPKWTLTELINHIIDNDIVLPTEDEIDGGGSNIRSANAAALPNLATPAFYDEYESANVEYARRNPGSRRAEDDLRCIGESIYYEDPVTGMMRKRVGEFNLEDPRHPVHRAAAAAAGSLVVECGNE